MDLEHSSPFLVYPRLRKLLGSYNHIVLLCRIVFDSTGGILITTNRELAMKCCMTEREVQYSKKIILKKLSFIQHTYIGFPRKSKYTIDIDSFNREAGAGCPNHPIIKEDEYEDAPLPQKEKKVERFQYPSEFEVLWENYKPPLSNAKGNKRSALRAYEKAVKVYGRDKVVAALNRYMDSILFEQYPAHMSTFFNGIVKDTKYKQSFIDQAYEKRLSSTKKHKTGELDAKGLIQRTNEIQKALFTKYNTSPTIIEHRPRKEWVKFLGAEYVAIKIPHFMNKKSKVNVLFHIDELRENLYTHIHGITWNDKMEERYNQVNKIDLGEAHDS